MGVYRKQPQRLSFMAAVVAAIISAVVGALVGVVGAFFTASYIIKRKEVREIYLNNIAFSEKLCDELYTRSIAYWSQSKTLDNQLELEVEESIIEGLILNINNIVTTQGIRSPDIDKKFREIIKMTDEFGQIERAANLAYVRQSATIILELRFLLSNTPTPN